MTFDLWHWKSIGIQTHVKTKSVPSLVKIYWRMLILECSQGCYAVTKFDPVTLTFNLWPWKSTGFQIFLRTKYVPSLVKIYWRSVHKDVTGYKLDHVTLTFDLWPWKSIGIQTHLKAKSVLSLIKIYRRMLILECSQRCYAVKYLTQWPWPLTYDLANQ